MGDSFMSGGIAYSSAEAFDTSYNEMLSVDADDQSMYLRGLGMAMTQRSDSSKLSQEGASELYWSMLIQPLQTR